MDKREMDLLKANVVKDRRRRTLYIIKGTQTGYHLQENDLKVAILYGSKSLLIIFPFTLLFGVLKINLLLSLLASAAVFVAVELYFKHKTLKDKAILKINDDDMKKLTTPEYYKSKSYDILLTAVFAFFFIAMIITGTVEAQTTSSLDWFLAIISSSALGGYLVYNLVKFFAVRKQYLRTRPAKVKKKKK